MAQYIDKDVLLAEIKEYIDYYNKGYTNGDNYKVDMLKTLLHDIDFFEVKEVDLEKEIEKEWLNCDLCRENTILEYANMGIKKFRTIAKHFFKLGLKTKGE